MTRARWIVVAVAAACLMLALVAGPVGLQLARIEGAAMAPTLVDQDRIIVNRRAYALS